MKLAKTVVFLGPDGAGKTTLIRLVEDDLAARGVDCAKFYFAPGFLKRYRPSPTVTVTTNPHEGRQYSTGLAFLKISLLLFEFRMGLARLRRAHEVLLFDRFIHDLLVDPKRYRMGQVRWWMRAMLKLAPLADLCVTIIAPVSVIQARKQEVTPEETARQIEAYKGAALLFPRSLLIENDGPPEALAGVIVEEIVKE